MSESVNHPHVGFLDGDGDAIGAEVKPGHPRLQDVIVFAAQVVDTHGAAVAHRRVSVFALPVKVGVHIDLAG